MKEQKYVWVFHRGNHLEDYYFETKELCINAVGWSYANWKAPPTIKLDTGTKIVFEVADGTMLQAERKPIFNTVEHL